MDVATCHLVVIGNESKSFLSRFEQQWFGGHKVALDPSTLNFECIHQRSTSFVSTQRADFVIIAEVDASARGVQYSAVLLGRKEGLFLLFVW